MEVIKFILEDYEWLNYDSCETRDCGGRSSVVQIAAGRYP